MKVSCIYKIENLVNGKVYIGQTVNFKIRKRHHLNALRTNRHPNDFLQKSFNIHKEENFEIAILELTENLDEKEVYWINSYNSTDYKFGYNFLTGGSSFKMNSYTKKRISTGIKRFYKNNPSAREVVSKRVSGENNPFHGKKHTKESIEKIIQNRSWYRHSEETKRKMSEQKKGEKHPHYGKTFSDEWRSNLSKAHLGQKAANKKEFSEAEIQRIIFLYKEGKTYPQIASELGVSATPIKRVLKERGIFETKVKRMDFSEDDLAKIRSSLEEGQSMRSIAKEYGISATGLKKKLIKLKII